MTKKHDEIRTPLGKARGAGASGTGSHHWIAQRLTAVALIPLTIWMISCVACLTTANYAEFTAYVSSPFVAVPLILFVIMSLWHGVLGVQEIIIDYVTCKCGKPALKWFTWFMGCAMGVACLFSILKISLG